jgi:hypothetical protein
LKPFARAAGERIVRISEERRRRKEVILAEHRKKRRDERDVARQTQQTP